MEQQLYTIIQNITPIPLLVDNRFLNGHILTRPSFCLSCQNPSCIDTTKIDKYCPQGCYVSKLDVANENIKIIGILTHESKKIIPLKLRAKYTQKLVKESAIMRWQQNLQQTIQFIQNAIQNQLRYYTEGFHDITPMLSMIIRNAEALIQKAPGNGMSEKFDNSDTILQTLYKSAEMLNKHLDFMNYIVNPLSITYGAKRETSVYKLLDKMCRIFLYKAQQKHIDINLQGSSFQKTRTYDSFAILIFVLLENALKYSYEGQSITIQIKDQEKSSIFLDIMSLGPVVPPEKIEKIFLKHERFIHASQNSDKTQGHGLGLYIADIIAKAHGFKINYKSEQKGQKDNIPFGINHFYMTIPFNNESFPC